MILKFFEISGSAGFRGREEPAWSRNLDFRNPRPRISLHTKFQLSTIILKEFEKFLGVRVLGGWGVAPTISRP